MEPMNNEGNDDAPKKYLELDAETRAKINRDKIKFYSNKDIELHIVKIGGRWINAYVLSEVSPDVYEIKERKLGKGYIFVPEVYSVKEAEQYKEGEFFKGGFTKQ